MLKFYVRHGMIVDKFHEIISPKQSKWYEKYIGFNTQKEKKAKHDFERDFNKVINNAFYGKTMENVRNRSRSEFVKKYGPKTIIKQQSQLTSDGIHNSY